MASALHRLIWSTLRCVIISISTCVKRCRRMQKSKDCTWDSTHIEHQAVCSELRCELTLLPFGCDMFTKMLECGNEQLWVHQAAPSCSCGEQLNETDELTAGKAVSPPSSVVLAKYSNTVATLGESSTRES